MFRIGSLPCSLAKTHLDAIDLGIAKHKILKDPKTAAENKKESHRLKPKKGKKKTFY